MRFLIKSIFWLTLILILIPFGGSETEGQPAVGPMETFFAAKEALGDIMGICERLPDTCAVGTSIVQTLGIRAREAARMAFTTLDERFGKEDEQLNTGAIPEEQNPQEERQQENQ